MTLQDLSQHYDLRRKLKKDEGILAALREAAYPKSPVLSDMPHAPGVRDKVGDLAVEIADMSERVRYLREEITRQEQEVEAFISSIQDEYTALLFRLRFLRCLTWGEVAGVVGGSNTEDGVKSTCYRYLASQEIATA